MQLTNKAEYAIRLVMFLSSTNGKLIKAEHISEKESIPRPFLSQIVVDLRKAGLVKAVRGLGGGLQLAKKPESITVLDVVEAIEGPVSVFKCVEQTDYCEKRTNCPLCGLWQVTQKKISDIFSKTSIKDLQNKRLSRR